MKSEENAVRMTEGSISRALIAFTLPVFCGQLFQQLYNTADTLIVGQLLDSRALAAVSSSGNLIFLLVGFFNGMAMGASVVISRFYGAGDEEKVRKAVHTVTALGAVLSIVLTIFGVWASPILLRWMDTPADVIGLSNTYFSIYFAGVTGLVFYNLFSSIMRAVGDSKTPLYFLIFSSILNILLDLFMIGVMGMNVEGAAIATVLSQLISALLSMFWLMKSKGPVQLRLREVRFDWPILKDVVYNGFPSGVQNSIISLANTVVQSQINHFGYAAMAGCGAYAKIEGFAFLPIMSFGMAASTFISQNLGAGKTERAKSGAKMTIMWSVIAAELVGLVFFIWAPQMIAWFDSNPEVIAYGTGRARSNALFYFLLAYSHAISAVCRGASKPAVPMWIMMAVWCFLRVAILKITEPYENIQFLYWVYPLTWGISSICFYFFWRNDRWLRPSSRRGSNGGRPVRSRIQRLLHQSA